MKIRISILLIFIFIGCRNEERIKPLNFIEKDIILQDKYTKKIFSKVNLFIPIEFDTLLIWTDASDCGCCDVDKYRLTNSKNCLITESGFFKHDFCKDSIERLTIEHQCAGIDSFKLDTTILNKFVEKINAYNDYFPMPKTDWKAKKIGKINGKDFIIIDFFGQNEYSKKPYAQIIASTISKKTWVTFRFECNQNDCSNFSKKAYQILNSIQIDTL